MYQVKNTSRSEFVPIRNQTYHVRVWGHAQEGVAPLVLVHGWMDVAASFQFVVDAMQTDRHIVAPDWRGYGQTEWRMPPGTTEAPPDAGAKAGSEPALQGPRPPGRTDNYWFADYLADLDFLIDHYSPKAAVDLLGHSLGGNVVMHYAGIRPERVRRLINLEGFGVPASHPAQAVKRLGKWMDELKALHRGEMSMRPYDTVDGVARRLSKTNPRLARDDAGRAKADWLARQWAAPDTDGRWAILGDEAHKVTNAHLMRVEEVLELYRRITAPVLMVEAEDNSLDLWWQGKFTLAEFHERLQAVPDLRRVVIEDAGHMLHHDQPERLAALLNEFLT